MIPSWIEEEYTRRRHGVNRALTQSQHDRVNARYPGATLEYCCLCGQPTGKAGPGEDSLYDHRDGPYCAECFWREQEARHG